MKTIFFLEKSTVFPFVKHSFSTDKASSDQNQDHDFHSNKLSYDVGVKSI